jgi:hypothetical protein
MAAATSTLHTQQRSSRGAAEEQQKSLYQKNCPHYCIIFYILQKQKKWHNLLQQSKLSEQSLATTVGEEG